MQTRPNSMLNQEVATALQTSDLFLMQRDYFGAPEEERDFRSFECAMEYDPAIGRVEVHFFAAWQDAHAGQTAPLLHLMAACQADGSITPSILTIEGRTYNARRLSHFTFLLLLSFIGQTRHCRDDAGYARDLAAFHNTLKPALLVEMRDAKTKLPAQAESFFQWGELSLVAAA